MANAPSPRRSSPQVTPIGPYTALLVTRGGGFESALRERLRPLGGQVDVADSAERACRMAAGLWYDVVVVDSGLTDGGAMDLCARMRAQRGGPCVVVYAERASLELATHAMRSGAFDLLSPESSAAEFIERLRSAIAESGARRSTVERERRLKKLCHKLDRARQEVTGQVGELCGDLAGAYKDLTEQIGDLAIAGELNGLLRQELDVESLLRTFLEYLLARVGSTNAGVFLPNSLGEYTLGAYINYDRPKASAEPMLESMADVVASAFENDREVVRMTRASQVRARLGEHAGWFDEQTVLAVGSFDSPGDAGTECLAVLCLFRDRRTPFSTQAVRTVQIAAELFGRQMARVIRVHHRHVHEDLWGSEDDIDDIDLAA